MNGFFSVVGGMFENGMYMYVSDVFFVLLFVLVFVVIMGVLIWVFVYGMVVICGEVYELVLVFVW